MCALLNESYAIMGGCSLPPSQVWVHHRGENLSKVQMSKTGQINCRAVGHCNILNSIS